MREELRDRRAWPLLAGVLGGCVLIYLLQPILAPFLAGALLAYLGDPLADRLEARGLGRAVAVTVVFTALSLVGVGVILLLIPVIGGQIEQLRTHVPQIIDWFQGHALPWIEQTLGVSVARVDMGLIRQTIAEHWGTTGNVLGAVLARVSQSSLALIGTIANLALVPVVTFYLLRDWDRLIDRIRVLLPRRIENTVATLARECDEVVAAFLRGQLLVMLCLGVIYGGGLWLVGVNLALLIGLVAGIANIVPYLGFILGIGIASVVTVVQFSDFWLPLAMVWGVFLFGQAMEGMVLTPWLVGDRIGLHPVAVIFAVLAGGQLFGFVGVLLALPVAAMVAVLLRHAHDHYVMSTLYETEAPTTSRPQDSDYP